MRKQRSRRALYGWMFYTPPVLCIVGVLAFDAYLNIEKRRNDYEVNALKRRATEVNDEIEKVRSKSAAAQQLHRLQEQAMAMGLREPEPWQIQRVVMPNAIRPASEFTVARVIPQPPEPPKRATPAAVGTASTPGLSPAPEPVLPAVPDTTVLAEAPVKLEPIELPLLQESAPAHVARLEAQDVEARDEEAPSAALTPATRRAPLAPLASPDMEAPVAPSAPEAPMPTSLDESVESMLAL